MNENQVKKGMTLEQWKASGQDPAAFVDVAQTKYGVTAKYDEKTQKVVGYDQQGQPTMQWGFDAGKNPVRENTQGYGQEQLLKEYQNFLATDNKQGLQDWAKRNQTLVKQNQDALKALYVQNQQVKRNQDLVKKVQAGDTNIKSTEVYTQLDPITRAKIDKATLERTNASTEKALAVVDAAYETPELKKQAIQKFVQGEYGEISGITDLQNIAESLKIEDPNLGNLYNQRVQESGLEADIQAKAKATERATELLTSIDQINESYASKYPQASAAQRRMLARQDRAALVAEYNEQVKLISSLESTIADKGSLITNELNFHSQDLTFSAQNREALLSVWNLNEKVIADREAANVAYTRQVQLVDRQYEQGIKQIKLEYQLQKENAAYNADIEIKKEEALQKIQEKGSLYQAQVKQINTETEAKINEINAMNVETSSLSSTDSDVVNTSITTPKTQNLGAWAKTNNPFNLTPEMFTQEQMDKLSSMQGYSITDEYSNISFKDNTIAFAAIEMLIEDSEKTTIGGVVQDVAKKLGISSMVARASMESLGIDPKGSTENPTSYVEEKNKIASQFLFLKNKEAHSFFTNSGVITKEGITRFKIPSQTENLSLQEYAQKAGINIKTNPLIDASGDLTDTGRLIQNSQRQGLSAEETGLSYRFSLPFYDDRNEPYVKVIAGLQLKEESKVNYAQSISNAIQKGDDAQVARTVTAMEEEARSQLSESDKKSYKSLADAVGQHTKTSLILDSIEAVNKSWFASKFYGTVGWNLSTFAKNLYNQGWVYDTIMGGVDKGELTAGELNTAVNTALSAFEKDYKDYEGAVSNVQTLESKMSSLIKESNSRNLTLDEAKFLAYAQDYMIIETLRQVRVASAGSAVTWSELTSLQDVIGYSRKNGIGTLQTNLMGALSANQEAFEKGRIAIGAPEANLWDSIDYSKSLGENAQKVILDAYTQKQETVFDYAARTSGSTIRTNPKEYDYSPANGTVIFKLRWWTEQEKKELEAQAKVYGKSVDLEKSKEEAVAQKQSYEKALNLSMSIVGDEKTEGTMKYFIANYKDIEDKDGEFQRVLSKIQEEKTKIKKLNLTPADLTTLDQLLDSVYETEFTKFIPIVGYNAVELRTRTKALSEIKKEYLALLD